MNMHSPAAVVFVTIVRITCTVRTKWRELYMKAQNALVKAAVFQMPADSEVET